MLLLFRTYYLRFSKHITAISDASRKVVLRVWFQTQQHQPASFDKLLEMQVLRPHPNLSLLDQKLWGMGPRHLQLSMSYG